MRPLHHLFCINEWRGASWRKKQSRHYATNDCAMKSFVFGQIIERWISAAATHRELNWTLAEASLQFIKVEIEPAARITDDHNGFWLHASSPQCPEIPIVVQRRSITN